MDDHQLAQEIELLPYKSRSPVPFRDWNFHGHTRTGRNILAGDFRNKATGRKKIVSVDKVTRVPLIIYG